MLQYLLGATTTWLVSLVLYDIFLRRENYHGYNRFYLLFTFLLGSFLPLWQGLRAGHNFTYTPDRVFGASVEWGKWLAVIYLCGVALALFLLFIDIFKLVAFYRIGNKSTEEGWTIIETGKEHPPFSYLDILFITSRASYSDDEWNMILSHEKQHSILLHLIDLLLMQLARIIFWFHPLVYIYNKRLLLVHEYQADMASSQQPKEYGRFLVEQAVLQAAPALSHSFNRSPIKNRIIMLTKNASPRTGTSNLKLLLVVPLTLACLFFFTKNSFSENRIKPGATSWKKQVSRVIDITEKSDTVFHHLRDVGPDATLLEMLVKDIKAGKITAYSNRDGNFTTKLTIEALNEMLPFHMEPYIATEPGTGKEITKFAKNDFDYTTIHKYRILEEWTYNPGTGKTEIEITGIAPIRNIYGSDGLYHGHQAMFYLRYTDIKNILAHYELYHPNNTFTGHIWDDYFNSDEEKTVKE